MDSPAVVFLTSCANDSGEGHMSKLGNKASRPRVQFQFSPLNAANNLWDIQCAIEIVQCFVIYNVKQLERASQLERVSQNSFHFRVTSMHSCIEQLPGARAGPYPHACTSRPHHCRQVLTPGLEPPGCRQGEYEERAYDLYFLCCRSGPISTFMVGYLVIIFLCMPF